MMLYPAMKDLLEKIPSRYELVNVVAHRAREIAAEAEAFQEELPDKRQISESAEEIGEPLDEKPVTLAIQEVADGKLEAPEDQENETTEEETHD